MQEAGGIVTDMSGNEGWLESGDIVAANPSKCSSGQLSPFQEIYENKRNIRK